MASGYETRQPGRSTFAAPAANPVQVSPSAQGNSRGVQIIGGESKGGVISGEVSTPGVAGQLGSFFGNIMEPHIKRRQEEEFTKGAVAQMSRQAGDEIHASEGGFSKIFGQTSFVEGAVAYRVQKTVNDWGIDFLAKKDELKKLSSEDVSRYVSDSITKLSSGDPYTDNQMKAAVFEASGPLVQTIAKEAYVWGQETAAINYAENTASAGTLYHQLGVAAASQSVSGEQTAAFTQAGNNFRASLMKPHGMDEETWKKSLIGSYKQAAQSGNGYAVAAIKEAGFLNALTDEERTKLEEAEFRLSSRPRNEAAMTLAPDISALDGNIAFVRISANEAMAEAARINTQFKRLTGFEFDLFDYKDVVGAGKSVWTALKAQKDRDDTRQWALEDALTKRNWEREDKAEETQRTVMQVAAAWGSGQVALALNMQIGNDGNFQTLAQADFVAGNFSRMVAAHRQSGWTAKIVSDQMQANIKSAIGKEYSDDFEIGYRRFEALNTADQATAADYMGDLYNPLLNYKRMVASGTSKTVAFGTAFGNPAQYTTDGKEDKAADTAIDEYIAGQTASAVFGVQINPFSRTNLNASGAQAMRNAMRREVGVRMKGAGSDLPPAALVAQIETQMLRNGSFERYGQLGWGNRPGTKPLWQHMGMQAQEAEHVVPGVIDTALKAAGYSDGGSGDNYTIRQIKGPTGLVIAVQPFPDDGEIYSPTIIPVSDFVAAGNAYRAGRVATPTPPMATKHSKVNAYRRIAGETGAARLARISREVAAGADPVNHFHGR